MFQFPVKLRYDLLGRSSTASSSAKSNRTARAPLTRRQLASREPTDRTDSPVNENGHESKTDDAKSVGGNENPGVAVAGGKTRTGDISLSSPLPGLIRRVAAGIVPNSADGSTDNGSESAMNLSSSSSPTSTSSPRAQSHGNMMSEVAETIDTSSLMNEDLAQALNVIDGGGRQSGVGGVDKGNAQHHGCAEPPFEGHKCGGIVDGSRSSDASVQRNDGQRTAYDAGRSDGGVTHPDTEESAVARLFDERSALSGFPSGEGGVIAAGVNGGPVRRTRHSGVAGQGLRRGADVAAGGGAVSVVPGGADEEIAAGESPGKDNDDEDEDTESIGRDVGLGGGAREVGDGGRGRGKGGAVSTTRRSSSPPVCSEPDTVIK